LIKNKISEVSHHIILFILLLLSLYQVKYYPQLFVLKQPQYVKVKVKLSLCLTKYHAMKTHSLLY